MNQDHTEKCPPSILPLSATSKRWSLLILCFPKHPRQVQALGSQATPVTSGTRF